MDQEKIGKFIQELRHKKNLTQSELASKLNVTDRAISKWENGRGLPDLSLIKPLCDELDISINELLSGEKLNKKEYNEKLEENIENTILYSESKIKSIKGKIKVFLIVILTIVSVILVDTFQAILFKNSPLIGFRNDLLADEDALLIKGILVDVYYCTEDRDIVTVYVKGKFSKFNCPVDRENMCPPWPNIVPTMQFEESKVMSMTIKNGTLTSKGCTIIIRDENEEKEIFGEEYRIDVFENNEWKQAEIILEEDYGWNLIGYLVGEDGTREMNINWEWLYGELQPGHYRIVKHISPKPHLYEYFSVEFDIE